MDDKPPWKVRRAAAGDASQICSLHRASIRQLCSTAYTAAEIAAWVEPLEPQRYLPLMRQFEFYVVEDEEVVGFLILDLDSAELNALYLHPRAVGRGIGRRLVALAEDRARQTGLRKLRLKATLNAVGFYQACGFERVCASRCEHPSGQELACIEMTKTLTGCEAAGETRS
jgi:GNAT superfamily N-acetyltransferase